MSLLLVGISHHSASLGLLERIALDAAGVKQLTAALLASSEVTETVVLATCNRVELYAEVSSFHGGLAQLGQALAQVTGVELTELAEHFIVQYAADVVSHLFTVACGLDSMAVGEGQVLGQLRLALRQAQDQGQTGRVLEHLLQQALRVGKRAHSETNLDLIGSSLVEAGLTRAVQALGPITGLKVLVLGAGSMSALAATTVRRAEPAELTIANRTPEKAAHLAAAVGATAIALAELPAALTEADLVITCTGALGHVLDYPTAEAAQQTRQATGRPAQFFIDLALPRDVSPQVAQLPGVGLADLATLGADLAQAAQSPDLDSVRELVAAEVQEYLSAVRMQSVAPTVAALRERAATLVQTELDRLDQRLPGLAPQVQDELRRTVHRVVEKLLHAPTVRVKELATRADGQTYAGALRELFDLPELPSGQALARAGAPLRLGTRRSPLALAQSSWVARELTAATGIPVQLVELSTAGDQSMAPLTAIGGTGVFATALREALLAGTVDFAVHSLKDLPTAPAPGLVLAAIPKRSDARDAVITRTGLPLAELPPGTRIGTGSPRRAAQLKATGRGHLVTPIRGNVNTRISLVHNGSLDAILLAQAGLLRLGRAAEATEILELDAMLPAPGQGALAVECRSDRPQLIATLAQLDHPATRAATTAERSLLATLEAGCLAPLGAFAEQVGEQLELQAVVASPDGVRVLSRTTTGPATDAVGLGRRLAQQMLADGAAELLDRPLLDRPTKVFPYQSAAPFTQSSPQPAPERAS